MPTAFAYPCPGCRSASDLHEADCDFGGRERGAIEAAYADVLGVLSAAGSVTPAELRDRVDGAWTPLHDGVLDRLRTETRVVERGDRLVMLTPEERREQVSTPTHDPLRTIYKTGSFSGCHDNSVFAMISFYEMQGFDWPETRERVIEWLRESGAWDRPGWSESSPEEVVDSKRHVWAAGYGWKEKATAAKRVIDRKAGGGAGGG